MQKAIEKINVEMQKDPNNEYLEIIGHYIIDRCAKSDEVSSAVNSGKTLKGAMDEIRSVAKKKAKGGCGVLRDNEIFDIVDKYLCAPVDEQAREESKRSVDGAASAPTTKPALNLDFESLLS